jgi:hypothetical protein
MLTRLLLYTCLQSNPAVITTHEEKPHGLGEGDYVEFCEVKGMVEINNPDRDSEEAGEKKEVSPLAAVKVLSTKGTRPRV